MKNLLNKLFPNFFKKQNNEETKTVVEIPAIVESVPSVTTIVFKEPVVTCKCNCGNKDCKCDTNCSCENCGCKCDSNCACKNKKKSTKRLSVKKQIINQPATKQPATKQPATKQPATKQPATKQPIKKVDNTKNKPGKPKNKKK